MFRSIARRREEKIIFKLKKRLEREYPGSQPFLESVPCHLDPRYSHMGIVVTSEVGVQEHHHVCYFIGEAGRPSFGFEGRHLQTKGAFHFQDYHYEGRANVESMIWDVGFFPWYWSEQLRMHKTADGFTWDCLYPGVPFIGDGQPIPRDFEFPTLSEQFSYLESRLMSGELTLEKYDSLMSFLFRKFHSARIWPGRSSLATPSPENNANGRRPFFAPFTVGDDYHEAYQESVTFTIPVLTECPSCREFSTVSGVPWECTYCGAWVKETFTG